MDRRPRRWRLAALLVGLLVVTAASVGRRPVLSFLGWQLVSGDPIGPADVIIIAIDSGSAGVLEAADLYHTGVAPRIAVFTDPPNPADREFLKRGVAVYDRAKWSAKQLVQLGAVEPLQIPRAVSGTEEQGPTLRAWCETYGFRSMIVVTLPDHSRRVRRVLRRSIDRSAIKVMVHPAGHAEFDPDGWWLSRTGTRTAIVELEKLVLDVLRHPI
jgi:hypothetical protein